MQLKKNINKRKGQIALEYLLVVMAVIGFGMAAYQLIQQKVQKPLRLVKNKMENGDAWSGGEKPTTYYQNMEFKKK